MHRSPWSAALPVTNRLQLSGQACFQTGHDEVDLRHRLLCIAEHRCVNAVRSNNRLLTTIAYQLGGEPVLCSRRVDLHCRCRGAVGCAMDLQIIDDAAQSGELAEKADAGQSVYLVPAFTGLGAPYWDAECRGALFGLTRGTGRAEVAKCCT